MYFQDLRTIKWRSGSVTQEILKSLNVKPIKFHALRACFATQKLANGAPAPVVMKFDGWKKTATTDIYLRLAGVDTKEATEA